MTTIVDLELKADSSSLDKAVDALRKTANATKEVSNQQALLTVELRKLISGFDDLDRNARKAGSAMESATSIGRSLGLAISATAIAAGYFALKTIDAMDSLNDLSDATGASIGNLSALQDVAQRTGVNFETVERALVKFNDQLKDAKPKDAVSNALNQIGLSAKQLKDMDPADALHTVAVALNGYADDANKARLTQELFGKSVKDVAPYLKDLGEQSELVATTTEAETRAAEEFNKQIGALEANTSKLARTLLNELLPAANEVLKTFNDKGFKAGITALLERAFGVQSSIQKEKIDGIKQSLQFLKKEFEGSTNYQYQSKIAGQIEEKLAELKKYETMYYKLTDGSAGGGRGKVNPPILGDTRGSVGEGKGSTIPTEKPKTLDRELMSERQKLDALQGVSEEQQIINKYADDYYKKYPPKQVEELKNLELKELRIKQQKDAQAAAYEQSVKDFNLQTQIQDKHNSDLRNLKTDTDLRQIQIDVMKKFGATQTDVAIAQNAYNLEKAEELLLIRSAEGFRAGEEQALRNQIELLREKGKQLGATKSMDDTEADRQKTFSYGWEQSFNKYKETAENAATHAQSVFATASKGMEEAISNFVKTGKLDFASLTASIINNLIQIQAQKFTVNLLSGLFSANGNVFSNGNVLKSADGNVFDKPTLHGYSGGLGMLGEAGPESIMPLKRNAQGQLGVIAQGGGSSSNVTVTNNITVQGTNSSMKDSIEQAKLISNAIDVKIKQSLAKEQLPGGMLSGASRRF